MCTETKKTRFTKRGKQQQFVKFALWTPCGKRYGCPCLRSEFWRHRVKSCRESTVVKIVARIINRSLIVPTSNPSFCLRRDWPFIEHPGSHSSQNQIPNSTLDRRSANMHLSTLSAASIARLAALGGSVVTASPTRTRGELARRQSPSGGVTCYCQFDARKFFRCSVRNGKAERPEPSLISLDYACG